MMTSTRSIVCAAVLILSAASPVPALADTRYELLKLSPGIPHALNDNGKAVGGAYRYDPTGLGVSVAPGGQTPFVGYQLEAITDADLVFGSYFGCAGTSLCYNHPLSFPQSSLVPEDLDFPMAATDERNVVGTCYEGPSFTYFSAAACGVLDGTFKFFSFDSNGDSGDYLFFQNQAATAINRQGVVVGQATVNDGPDADPQMPASLHAFRYSDADGMQDLGTLGGESSAALDINEAGTIVGTARNAQGDTRGFSKTADGMMQEVTVYLGTTSQIHAVNDEGEFVGDSTVGAVVGSGTSATILQALLHPAFKFSSVLQHAYDINNNGEIVGEGILDFSDPNGPSEGFLLRPLPQMLRPFPFTGNRSPLGGADLLVWRPSDGRWYSKRASDSDIYNYFETASPQWGLPGDVPVFGADIDGDLIDDLLVWRPSDGSWYRCLSTAQYACDPSPHQFGLTGDIPVAADYDGDGKTDQAVFRRSLPQAAIIGQWYIQRSSDGEIETQQWGLEHDYPVPADYDGDGKADLAVFRPSTATWFVRLSSDGSIISRQFGLPADHPMPRDVDADGKTDLVVFRPQSANWYFCTSRNDFVCFDAAGDLQVQAVQYGLPGDLPLLRNIIGGRTFPLAVWRPVDQALQTQAVWYTHIVSTAAARQQWGLIGDIPAGIGVRDLLRLTGLE
jgi:probable HAF family extracellular repeat protein